MGRTGTFIALDTLLQQLERDKAVGINGFVYKMRLNRPYMVQTEVKPILLPLLGSHLRLGPFHTVYVS